MSISCRLLVEDRFGSIVDEYLFHSGEILLGRHRDCDVVLPADSVSRRHARIVVTKDRVFVEDLNSSNGTFVNGVRVHGRAELFHNSVVRIGDYRVHIKGAKPQTQEDVVLLRLLGRRGLAEDQVFEVRKTVVLVGRGKEADLTILDPSVSRSHARFMIQPGGRIMVEDLDSSNGTYVNGRRIKVWELSQGDLVRFGDIEFSVDIPSAQTADKLPKGRGIFEGMSIWWGVGGGIAVGLLVALALWLGGASTGRQETATLSSKTDALERQVTTPVLPRRSSNKNNGPKLDPRKIRELAGSRRFDAARRQLEDFLALHPTSTEAVRLMNWVKAQKAWDASLGKARDLLADKKFAEGVRELLEVPADTVFAKDLGVLLARYSEALRRQVHHKCRGRRKRSVECVRARALLRKVERRLEGSQNSR